MDEIKKTKIFSAFPGCGKTFICEKTQINAIEIEYWKYKNDGKLDEYISDIKRSIGNVDYVFISTDPEGLNILKGLSLEITLVYPKNELRYEYLDRYLLRDSPPEFIGAFMKFWHIWLDELKKIKFCKHFVLSKNEYLASLLTEISIEEDIPVKISQSWRGKTPVVSSKQTYFDYMKPVSREVWFEYIKKGWLTVNSDVRKWLDSKGFEHIKRDVKG